MEYQLDEVTKKRVLASLNLGDLPEDFVNDLENNISTWAETEFIPTYTNAITYAANGSGQIAGMMDDINTAIGANILFNPATNRMVDYIQEKGAELVVDVTRQQIGSLKSMLTDALKNNWDNNKAYDMMTKAIGITDLESKWLAKFDERTYQQQLKYFREEYPQLFPDAPKLTEKQIEKRARNVTDRRVEIKHKKYLNGRIQRIKNTELTRAKHFGEIEAHKQALAAGKIDAAYKQWNKNNFEDNWESSNLYHGKRIGIDESFSQFGIPFKTTMRNFNFPGEINENCSLIYYVRKK